MSRRVDHRQVWVNNEIEAPLHPHQTDWHRFQVTS